MAQVVERPLWEREVPGSSPGAPIRFFMVQHASWRSPVYNITHTPSDAERVSETDGIRTEISVPFKAPYPFGSLVLSANYDAQEGDGLLLEVQVCAGGKWSDFYKLGMLTDKVKTGFPPQQTSFGRLETDELVLSAPAEAYRYRLKLMGRARLTFLAAALVRAPFEYDEKNASRLPLGSFEKEVEPLSQMELKHPDRRRVCSPVSLCMALRALGVNVPLEEVLHGVYDPNANIYGNWLFNTAYAGRQGVEAYVRRFGSLAELKDFVSEDSLTVASIAYEHGELGGAAIDRTPGHLVLVRGWQHGKVLTADPAASTRETVLRAYDAREFANAWLNHKKGVAYIVRKK